MIKLIVGLGNPGQQYNKTRHNAGFLFLDALADEYAVSWDNELKFQGLVASTCIMGHKVFFLKPQTFMNRSGVSVGALVRYYKLSAEEVLVVHDELDLRAGVVRLKSGGGHAGHNGLRDIIAHLGVKDFYRLRVGIGRPLPGKSVSDFVLSGFSKDDVGLVKSCFDFVGREMGDIVLANMALVMNKLNAK